MTIIPADATPEEIREIFEYERGYRDNGEKIPLGETIRWILGLQKPLISGSGTMQSSYRTQGLLGSRIYGSIGARR